MPRSCKNVANTCNNAATLCGTSRPAHSRAYSALPAPAHASMCSHSFLLTISWLLHFLHQPLLSIILPRRKFNERTPCRSFFLTHFLVPFIKCLLSSAPTMRLKSAFSTVSRHPHVNPNHFHLPRRHHCRTRHHNTYLYELHVRIPGGTHSTQGLHISSHCMRSLLITFIPV